ncbi:4-amino-4-deoxy-L-arabinose transferase [Mucilaginibacter pineti]|uniref:4-amino-4-deoxy-L-arabinose transferase n=1 Tax=Mucilaginibacter pineti TaxID=1391627 RepID=A0A1G7J5V3_9SPHI|nr:glycosyltransferase family 39 protein [Mucilaginibacter pineti]SDF20164.1 4-amino-4-deoxy-L-arabinose transferase [Mucilaginibacter pineti]
MKDNYKPLYILLFALALLVNFAGINVNFFTDDPGLYASLSKNMVYRHEFWELFTYNQDWLDKPHFPFWMVLGSFKLFGISVWAYRLPALLFFLLSLLYTWLFARKHYGDIVAATAVLILMTAQHLIMFNTDVRAEPYLMGLIIGAIYHIDRLNDRFTFGQLLMAALLTACAVMTKGIFVVGAIYGALIGQLLFTKKLKQLFSFKWIALLLLTFIFTLPELYALYIQFDAHPEKVVFGRQQVSGIKWFLWDSQFGRFINKGPITKPANGNIFFFVHTLLWAFAPWCLLFYFALYKNIKAIWQKVKLPEYFTLGGALPLLALFSLSKFQLPFYTNILFPLFAIITAPLCVAVLTKVDDKLRSAFQWIYILVFPVAVLVIHYFLQPGSSVLLWIDIVVFGIMVYLISSKAGQNNRKIFLLNCLAVLFANFYVNTVLYPTIASYNGQITAAAFVNEPQFANSPVYALKSENNVFQFYCDKPVSTILLEDFKKFNAPGNAVFFVGKWDVDYLTKNKAGFIIIRSFENYPQEAILPNFINKATRPQVLDRVYLISKN